ncbi:MAG: RNA polymerase sigma factor [Agriterribacter sp.]
MRKNAFINYCWTDFVNNENRSTYYKMYEHYYAYLIYLGVKKGFNIDVIKDTVNDIFLYLWENRSRLQHIHNPHSYIITFFIRSLYKGEQHAKLHSSTDVQYEEYIADEFIEPACDKGLLDKEREQSLLGLINRQMEQLPPKQRQIIYQKFYLGLSYEEISKANRVSINTVYNTVYAAMDKLRVLIPRNTFFALISVVATLSAIIFMN